MPRRRMLRPVINYFKRPVPDAVRAVPAVEQCYLSQSAISQQIQTLERELGGEAPRLDLLQPERIRDTLHAYQLAKRCNEKRVMAESVRWGARGTFITGADFLIDGGATASYFYGPLKPES